MILEGWNERLALMQINELKARIKELEEALQESIELREFWEEFEAWKSKQ